MPVFQISYDLNKPGQDYDRLHAEIKRTARWAHVLASTWLVWTTETVKELQGRLNRVVHRNNRLFLSRVTRENGGWMDKAVWAWLNRRLAAEERTSSRKRRCAQDPHEQDSHDSHEQIPLPIPPSQAPRVPK
jgi:hypothetical protein